MKGRSSSQTRFMYTPKDGGGEWDNCYPLDHFFDYAIDFFHDNPDEEEKYCEIAVKRLRQEVFNFGV